MSVRAITLLFHDVVPARQWHLSGMRGADADIYKLDDQEFRRHIEAIAQRLSSPPITGAELLANSLVRTPVLLTFDDGGVSALTTVAGLLDEFGWKAHFLITTNRIGTRGFLDRTQIQELHRRGHIIGSHSYSHPARMSQCSATEVEEEWRQSVGVLTEIIGEHVTVASVPGGYYSHRVARSAAKCGIRLLFNSEPVLRAHSVDGCMVLGRFTVRRGNSPRRSAKLSVGSKTLQIPEYVYWNTKKAMKLLGGTVWLRARISLLAFLVRTTPRPGSDSKM